MQAAVLEQINSPLRLVDVTPEDLHYGQVLVRVVASGICGAQLQEIAGHKGNAKYLPHLMGHEGCGVVEATGPFVQRVKVGDRVVMHWRKAGGIEAAPARYQINGSKNYVGGGPVTTFCEQAVVSENRVTPVPAGTPVELCALLGCGLSTALATIEFEAVLRFGESILIVGCGGLGMNLIQAARLAQAGDIAAMDIHADKRDMVEKTGARFFLNDLPDSKFDVIVDTTGMPAALERTIPLLHDSGRYIMVGQPAPGTAVSLKDANHLFGGSGKLIRATQGGSFQPDKHMTRYIRLYQMGAIKLDELITHRFKLADVNKAIQVVRTGRAGRVILET
jgi:S-(hydroxymethyl)glutathione dehydrogenase/alcohol dehydrogenase